MAFDDFRAQRDAQANQTDQFQRRNQTAENSTRLATNAFTYTTSGQGQILVKQPIMFDCIFTQEPSFTSGVYVAQPPNVDLYRYPLVTAGIYKWVKELQKVDSYKAKNRDGLIFDAGPKAADVIAALQENEPHFYKGAYLYFVVRVDPNQTPRSDGSNLALLQAAFNRAIPGSTTASNLAANIAEAKLAIKLKANPAQLTLHHHLQFSGVAMKALSDSVMALAQDMHGTALPSGSV